MQAGQVFKAGRASKGKPEKVEIQNKPFEIQNRCHLDLSSSQALN
jgi:hypothetical protein